MTSTTELRRRIIAVLRDTPGQELSRADVLAAMGRSWEWSGEDVDPIFYRPAEKKWQNRASFEYAQMKRDGLSRNIYGVWNLI